MDPNTCLDELCDALNCDDTDTARERAMSLVEWLDKGGFMPTVAPGQLCCLLNILDSLLGVTGGLGEDD